MTKPAEGGFRPGSRVRPIDEEQRTLAKGRPWLTWLRCPAGRRLDRLLVRHVGWSPLYWLFGHRTDDGRLGGLPILLHTVGRVSGTERTVILPAIRRDDRWLICATLGGGPRDPQRALNLLATPQAAIHLRRRRIAVLARRIEGAEREALYPWLCERHPSLALYQQRAAGYGRVIPIIELVPA